MTGRRGQARGSHPPGYASCATQTYIIHDPSNTHNQCISNGLKKFSGIFEKEKKFTYNFQIILNVFQKYLEMTKTFENYILLLGYQLYFL